MIAAAQPNVAEGLSAEEARRRLTRFGPNELPTGRGTPKWRLLLGQFNSPLVLLLLGACVLAAALGEIIDASAIAVIVAINAVIGFVQEHRAEQAMQKLQSLTAPRARVVRGGTAMTIPAREIVPGDVLVLDAGDVVAADGKLVEAHQLSTIEASLTGESFPSDKSIEPAAADAPLAERHDMVFMGTSVAIGSGTAIVHATGLQTEMGKIAGLLGGRRSELTPLQRRLQQVGRLLLMVCLVLVGFVAGMGLLRGQHWSVVLLSSVSLAVAAVPEGLPAIVTIALAVGMQRMARRNVLIRRLSSVETLGSATVICTDKTGTLTTGKMAVRDVWSTDPHGLLQAAVACSDAQIGEMGQGVGDPTEVALLRAASDRGIERSTIEASAPRVEVHPFTPERRRMSVFRNDGRLYVKGALESLLPMCNQGTDGATEAADQMAQRGLRVLAVAVGQEPEERNLELLGLVGIADAPRPEAMKAIQAAHEAGVDIVMMTGDHPKTAQAIARELGLVRPGADPDKLVHARVTATDKNEIVHGLRRAGEVVAMTGDGVNDAPAIREADIGIAMGRTATEVTREASDMILTDDNLGSIVAAVEEGRVIYDNIRKSLVYLLAGNGAELTFVLVASILGLPLPLVPLQLLWINLMTEPFPALALVLDPPQRDVLRQKPRPVKEAILGPIQWRSIAFMASLQTLVALAAFTWALDHHGLPTARSFAFSTLVFGELLRAFAARSPDRLFWEVGALSNLKLIAVVLVSGALQVAIYQTEFTREVLHLSALRLPMLGAALALGFIPVSVVESSKLLRRLWTARKG